MDFYEKFSKYYDYIFPFQKPQFSFLSELVNNGETVLDLACGTGNYIVELCKTKDVKGFGIDLDEKMIDKAKSKGENLANLNLYTKNMLDLAEFEEKFNLIYCIGNSIPHLVEPTLIEKVIKDAYEKTEMDGKIVIQTVNYDRNPKNLKTIVNEQMNIKFVRNYEYKDNLVDFCTVLEGSGFSIEGRVKLYPLKSQELVGMLKRVGYKEVTLYGGFNKDPYNDGESGSMVVVAKK